MSSEHERHGRGPDGDDPVEREVTTPVPPSPTEPPAGPWRSADPGQPPRRSHAAPPARPGEVTSQLPPAQNWPPSGYRPPQAPNDPAGDPFAQPPGAFVQPPSAAFGPGGPGPAAWGPQYRDAPTAAPQGPEPRFVDGFSQVNMLRAAKLPPQRGWRRTLYALLRINLGLSPDEIYEAGLYNRIRRNANDSYQIGVLGLKGGVGKTAVSLTLGSVLSKVRGDRILAVDADPDAGNLAERAGRQSAENMRGLLAHQDLARYNDIRTFTSMNASNLEVLSSEDYNVARREFDADDWNAVVGVVSRYYNIVLADCGSGLFQSGSQGVLSTVSSLVIVASASIDGARQAAVTMDWLRQHGHQELLRRSCLVVNHVTPGKPNIDVNDLVQQFGRHLPEGKVIVLPWDKHIAGGAEIQFDLLGTKYRRRITELAAELSDYFGPQERR